MFEALWAPRHETSIPRHRKGIINEAGRRGGDASHDVFASSRLPCIKRRPSSKLTQKARDYFHVDRRWTSKKILNRPRWARDS